MGPRLFSRGNVAYPAGCVVNLIRFNGAAAFQPRKLPRSPPARRHRRGFNGAAAFQPRKRATVNPAAWHLAALQWGRGFSAAETCSQVGGVRGGDLMLQWGRGFSAAETVVVGGW